MQTKTIRKLIGGAPRWAIALGALALLAACGSAEVILPGERFDVRADGRAAVAPVNQTQSISLPRQQTNASWTHRAANPAHVLPHATFAAQPTLRWRADIGQGNGRKHRITADPVAADGRIFTMDSRAGVVATSATGARLWATDLTRSSDKSDDASGGGLAVVDGVLYAATGFGQLSALDAQTGALRWQQQLGAPISGAPTISRGQIYLMTRDSRGWVLDAETGRLRWQVTGAPSVSGFSGGAGPAVGATLAVFAFPSSQVTATFRREGFEAWQSSVAGGRLGATYARIADVSGPPIISGNRVYVGNAGGRTVALDLASGTRVWTAEVGATGPAVLAGGSLFSVSDNARLVRLNARNGAQIWSVDLPGNVPVRNENRRRDIFVNHGPILAGGRIWVASSDGALRAFDPASGLQTQQIDLGAGAATRPIVVGGVMYVVDIKGQLVALQ